MASLEMRTNDAGVKVSMQTNAGRWFLVKLRYAQGIGFLGRAVLRRRTVRPLHRDANQTILTAKGAGICPQLDFAPLGQYSSACHRLASGRCSTPRMRTNSLAPMGQATWLGPMLTLPAKKDAQWRPFRKRWILPLWGNIRASCAW